MNTKTTHCVFLFLFAFLLYSNTLSHGYVLDDSLFITGNSFTQKGIAGIYEIWTNDAFVGAHGRSFDLTGGRYRPLAITMFAIEYELFGSNAFPKHLINVLLFALTVVLLYVLLLKMLPHKNEWLPLIASLLFLIHPIHTEVVANIKSRDEILSLLFLLLSILSLIKYAEGRKIHLFSGALYYLLSLLSKENTITALAVFPLTLFLFTSNTIKQSFTKMLPLFITAIVYMVLRTVFAGVTGTKDAPSVMDNPYLYASFADKYATITMVCGKYLQLLFFPHPLSFDYSYNQIPILSWTNDKVILSLLSYATMLFVALWWLFDFYKNKRNKKKYELTWKPLLAYGILFYLFTFSVVSNFFFNIGAPMGERFIYLPSLGFCFALAVVLSKALKVEVHQPFRYHLSWLILFLLLVPVAAFATFQRNKAWESNYILYETDIKTVPNSARARLFYGLMLFNRFEKLNRPALLDSAIYQMEIACQINPLFYHAFYNKGIALQTKKDHEPAIKAFEKVLEIEPMHINAHYYLGLSYGKGLGQLNKAVYYMEKGLEYGYNGSDGNMNLGVAYAMKGNYDKAIAVFQEGLQQYPDNAQLHLNLAITYDNKGDKHLAEKYYQKAFELDPSLKKQ